MGAVNMELVESQAEQLPFAKFELRRRHLERRRHGFERLEIGELVDSYARSKFEDTRRTAKSSARLEPP